MYAAARQAAPDARKEVTMLYNLFCRVLEHRAFGMAKAIEMVISQSRLPRNLKQYYCDRLLLLAIASD